MIKKKLLLVIFILFVIPSFGLIPASFKSWLGGNQLGQWYNITSFSVITTTGQSMNGMQTIVGYKLKPKMGVGLGVGIERFRNQPLYDNFTANLTMLPIFLDFRYTFLKSRFSPFISVMPGYKVLLNIPSTEYIWYRVESFPGMAWNDYYDNDTYRRGGFSIAVETGMRAVVYKRFTLHCSLGYSLWSVSGDRNKWNYMHLSAPGGTEKVTIYFDTDRTRAITHTFMFRIAFGF